MVPNAHLQHEGRQVLQHVLNYFSANLSPVEERAVQDESIERVVSVLHQVIEQYGSSGGVRVAQNFLVPFRRLERLLDFLMKLRHAARVNVRHQMAVRHPPIPPALAVLVVVQHEQVNAGVEEERFGNVRVHEAVVPAKEPKRHLLTGGLVRPLHEQATVRRSVRNGGCVRHLLLGVHQIWGAYTHV